MISAIVVNHNGGVYLPCCISSLEQACCEEVIVVDNASTDGSAEWLRREHPACKLKRLKRNIGFSAANNDGVTLARGEYLLLLNADAWLAPGSLELLRAALDERPRAALVVPQLLYPDGRLQFTWAPETGVLGQAVQKLRPPWAPRRGLT